jgi:hypothetical protein
MIKFYAFAAILMVVIMHATTAAHRHTQSANGLMVRANWHDHQGDRLAACP